MGLKTLFAGEKGLKHRIENAKCLIDVTETSVQNHFSLGVYKMPHKKLLSFGLFI